MDGQARGVCTNSGLGFSLKSKESMNHAVAQIDTEDGTGSKRSQL